MSLIIAFNLKDGIVVASDKCTTHHENGKTMHCFNSEKYVLFGDKTIVLHCGDYFADDKNSTSIEEFLKACATGFNSDDIKALPIFILNQFLIKKYTSKNVFFVCGIDKNNIGFVYKVVTNKLSVECKFYGNEYGIVWDGIYNIANPILINAKCSLLTLSDAAILAEEAIRATEISQKYGINEQNVGGADVFVFPKQGDKFCLPYNGDVSPQFEFIFKRKRIDS